MQSCLLQYTLSAIKATITGEVSDISYEGIDMMELFRFAEMHKVANIIYPFLKKLSIGGNEAAMSAFEESYYKSVVFETQQQYYLELVEKALDEAGVMHMPMKGSVIKLLYPDPSFRTSCDVDLYVGKGGTERARQVMESLGFVVDSYDEEALNHDSYFIDNKFNFELHRELMPQTPYFKGVEVCPIIESELVKNNEETLGYHMTDEDFYVFMIIHIAKHIKHNGMGIRGFLDVWLYLRKYKETLDWQRVNKLFKKCGLCEFYENVVSLVEMWFENRDSVPQHIKEFAEHVAMSGVMGTREQVVSEELYENRASGNRFKYYIETIFLPLVFMRDKYKVLRRFPALLPFCWIHRVFNVVLCKRANISKMMNHFDGADEVVGEKSARLKKKLGL